MKSISILTGILLCSFVNATTTLNWAIDDQLFHQIKIARAFKSSIEKKLPNKVKINLFYVSDESGDEELGSGKYQITQMIAGNFSKEVPELKIWEMPFLFSSKQHVEKYLESKNARLVLSKIENEHILPVGYSYAGGFLHFYSSQKMNSFTEMTNKGCYIAPDYGFQKDFLEPLGLKGKHDFDAGHFECGEILASELDDIYSKKNSHNIWVNLTNHRVVARITLIRKEALKNLSAKEQDLLVSELKSFLKEERQLVYKAADLSLELIENKGAHINRWDNKNIAAHKKIFEKTYKTYWESLKDEVDFIHSLTPGSRYHISKFLKPLQD